MKMHRQVYQDMKWDCECGEYDSVTMLFFCFCYLLVFLYVLMRVRNCDHCVYSALSQLWRMCAIPAGNS